jgi:hypothetical protein
MTLQQVISFQCSVVSVQLAETRAGQASSTLVKYDKYTDISAIIETMIQL